GLVADGAARAAANRPFRPVLICHRNTLGLLVGPIAHGFSQGAAMLFRMPVAAPPLGSPLRSRRSPPLDRRRFLCGAGASLVAAPALVSGGFAQARWRADPFALGVASGAPRPDGFVLWTRLAPDPLSPDPATPGGMIGGDVPVTYEIASDPQMRDIVR